LLKEANVKLSVLVDNNTLIDRYFLAEPGLSFLIKEGGKKILFDVGYSDVFLKNAATLGISLRDIDYVVLSHGHLDHSWGLVPLVKQFTEWAIEKRAFKRPTLVAHPDAFNVKLKDSIDEFGSMLPQEKLARHFDLKLTKAPLQLTENVVFLGEIPRLNDFEGDTPIGKIAADSSGREQDDFIKEDSALAYKSKNGLVIVTGCSHSGICNITEHAKNVCNEQRIIDIIGGFHLQNPKKSVLESTLNYMKENRPTTLHACHCTDLDSKVALAGVANLKEVGAGQVLAYSR
jgi:7,8-dihydropterin-6-yl-methyl-4-(beta-D-ribofuranosyl)aminobenzene 5'-phosphate synthase